MSANRIIKKVAVLGSGIMGSRIACHFANIGMEVLLLDIIPRELTEEEKNKGLQMEDPLVRNSIVNTALQSTLKASPSPLYDKSFLSRIRTGNFSDNMKDVGTCDWILEAVIENLDIKEVYFPKLKSTADQEQSSLQILQEFLFN